MSISWGQARQRKPKCQSCKTRMDEKDDGGTDGIKKSGRQNILRKNFFIEGSKFDRHSKLCIECE